MMTRIRTIIKMVRMKYSVISRLGIVVLRFGLIMGNFHFFSINKIVLSLTRTLGDLMVESVFFTLKTFSLLSLEIVFKL